MYLVTMNVNFGDTQELWNWVYPSLRDARVKYESLIKETPHNPIQISQIMDTHNSDKWLIGEIKFSESVLPKQPQKQSAETLAT